MMDSSRQGSFTERYESGQIPWDDQMPPPELIALADQLDPGRALDLGSGYGRSSIYLAGHGWQVDGIEFVSLAVEESRRRARQAGVDHLTQFHVADVTDLDLLQGTYDLAIDIGCMHILNNPELQSYRDELKRLLHSGAHYLLFAHMRELKEDSDEAARWIEEAALRELFSDGFVLAQVVHGITEAADKPPWPSAWFHFHRL